VATDRSELSSLAALLDQVTTRIAAIAQDAAGRRDDSLAGELFVIERSLSAAGRRLERLVSPRR